MTRPGTEFTLQAWSGGIWARLYPPTVHRFTSAAGRRISQAVRERGDDGIPMRGAAELPTSRFARGPILASPNIR